MDCTLNYSEVFSSQFFTTLGQLSAAAFSAAVIVPMYDFYSPRIAWLLNNFIKQKSE